MVNRKATVSVYYRLFIGRFLNPNGLFSKLSSQNRAHFKPLCDKNMPVIVPISRYRAEYLAVP